MLHLHAGVCGIARGLAQVGLAVLGPRRASPSALKATRVLEHGCFGGDVGLDALSALESWGCLPPLARQQRCRHCHWWCHRRWPRLHLERWSILVYGRHCWIQSQGMDRQWSRSWGTAPAALLPTVASTC